VHSCAEMDTITTASTESHLRDWVTSSEAKLFNLVCDSMRTTAYRGGSKWLIIAPKYSGRASFIRDMQKSLVSIIDLDAWLKDRGEEFLDTVSVMEMGWKLHGIFWAMDTKILVTDLHELKMFSTKVGFSVVYVDALVYLLEQSTLNDAITIRCGMGSFPCHRRSNFDMLDQLVSRKSGTYFPAISMVQKDRMKAFGDTMRRLALNWTVKRGLKPIMIGSEIESIKMCAEMGIQAIHTNLTIHRGLGNVLPIKFTPTGPELKFTPSESRATNRAKWLADNLRGLIESCLDVGSGTGEISRELGRILSIPVYEKDKDFTTWESQPVDCTMYLMSLHHMGGLKGFMDTGSKYVVVRDHDINSGMRLNAVNQAHLFYGDSSDVSYFSFPNLVTFMAIKEYGLVKYESLNDDQGRYNAIFLRGHKPLQIPISDDDIVMAWRSSVKLLVSNKAIGDIKVSPMSPYRGVDYTAVIQAHSVSSAMVIASKYTGKVKFIFLVSGCYESSSSFIIRRRAGWCTMFFQVIPKCKEFDGIHLDFSVGRKAILLCMVRDIDYLKLKCPPGHARIGLFSVSNYMNDSALPTDGEHLYLLPYVGSKHWVDVDGIHFDEDSMITERVTVHGETERFRDRLFDTIVDPDSGQSHHLNSPITMSRLSRTSYFSCNDFITRMLYDDQGKFTPIAIDIDDTDWMQYAWMVQWSENPSATQTWLETQTHLVKYFTACIRKFSGWDKSTLYKLRRDIIVLKGGVAIDDNRVNGKLMIDGQWRYLALSGHLINLLLASVVLPVDFNRYFDTITSNLKGIGIDGLTAEVGEGVWHNFYEFDIAVDVYDLMCNQLVIPKNRRAIKLCKIRISQLYELPLAKENSYAVVDYLTADNGSRPKV